MPPHGGVAREPVPFGSAHEPGGKGRIVPPHALVNLFGLPVPKLLEVGPGPLNRSLPSGSALRAMPMLGGAGEDARLYQRLWENREMRIRVGLGRYLPNRPLVSAGSREMVSAIPLADARATLPILGAGGVAASPSLAGMRLLDGLGI